METDCAFLPACSGLGGKELKSRGMNKSRCCLCCGLNLVQIPVQHDGEDTGADWKAKFDGYLYLFTRARLGRGETQDSVVWEELS